MNTGKVILLFAFRDENSKVIESVAIKEGFLYELEKDSSKITHAEIDRIGGEKWNFPLKLLETISDHNRPQLSKNFELETAVVSLSNILALSRGIGFSGDLYLNPFNSQSWNNLRLRNEDLKQILKESEEPITSSKEIFTSDE